MNATNARRTLAALVLAAAAAVAAAETAFTGLSSDELAVLGRGEAVFRSLSSHRRLAIPATAPGGAVILEEMRKLGPNYLGETIMILPKAKDGEDPLGKLAALLADVEGYKGIPYWSAANKQYYDLFDKSIQTARRAEGGAIAIEALQHMEPFDDNGSRYLIAWKPGALTFSGENTSPLVYTYRNIKVLDPGKMRWMLTAYDDGDRFVLYGVGAARAFDMLGLFRDKIETSLVGRIKAFFGYMFAKR